MGYDGTGSFDHAEMARLQAKQRAEEAAESERIRLLEVAETQRSLAADQAARIALQNEGNN